MPRSAGERLAVVERGLEELGWCIDQSLKRLPTWTPPDELSFVRIDAGPFEYARTLLLAFTRVGGFWWLHLPAVVPRALEGGQRLPLAIVVEGRRGRA
jgi:hypothetical protein